MIIWVLFATKALPLTWPVLLALEVIVFLAEWKLLAFFLRLPLQRAALLSFASNATSALLGLLLPY